MNYKLALWTAVGLLAGGCAQQQASQGGAYDFEPLPLRDTASSGGSLPGTIPKLNLGKPIPASPGNIEPAEDSSIGPSPELIRERKRYEAVPL